MLISQLEVKGRDMRLLEESRAEMTDPGRKSEQIRPADKTLARQKKAITE